jgi:hypothetical protein
VIRAEAVLSSRTIDEVVLRSLTCLRTNFRTTETGAGGWYHYLDDPKPGVTASAVALYCFYLAGARFERTDEVVRYLLGQQIDMEGADHGGWAVRTTSGVPVVECTAWVVRALSVAGVRTVKSAEMVSHGAAWLERNQNTDFGWGSYKGQPSRVFTTALAMLALAECGGSAEVIANARKWLNDAQSPNQPAWGPLPGAPPSMLHTGIALMAQLAVHSSLPASALKQSVEWLLDNLTPSEFIEKSTTVEEYDVPYWHGSMMDTFQNSLPHFAMPVALVALLRAGCDPFEPKIFQAAKAIIDAQECDDIGRVGTWELPRSPRRPSIWAVWPFIAALTTLQRAIFPGSARGSVVESSVTLLYPGCVIVQTSTSPRHLTRRLLIKNAFLDWVRQRRFAISIWAVVLVTAAIPFALWIAKQLTWEIFLLALLLPILLLVFQILWDRRT